MYDIIIVGGNLSGATAAINAANYGAKVVLVEKNKKPFFPPRCGEATEEITANILNLDKIGCPKNQIKKITINVSSKKEYNFKTNHGIYIIDRYFLEKYLIKHAEQKGVHVILGSRMTNFNPPKEIVLDNKKTLEGKIIIDATGISCQIGKKIRNDIELKPSDIGVCIQSRVEGNFNSDTMKMWYGKPFAPFGYSWCFPKNETLANIGIGVPGGQKLNLSYLLDKYIEYEVKDKFKVLNTFHSCVPASEPLDPLIKDNIIFIGDAARFANPIFENGINNAIFSGSLAGVVAAKYIKGDILTLKTYEQLMKNKVKRLKKAYYKKNKLITEEKYNKSFKRMFSLLSSLNKIFPNILQNQFIKMLKNDKKVLDSIRKNEY